MIKKYIFSLAFIGLLCILAGCGGGDSESNTNAPVDSIITVSPEEIKISDGTNDVDTSTQFFHITVTDVNGIPYSEVEINISYIWAVPNINGLVQLYDGSTPVNSPMSVETDSNGTYILRLDFQSGGGLTYFGEVQVTSGSNFGSATFEVDIGE